MKTKIITKKDISNNHESCVLAYGHFTTIHTGHIRYLNYAKKKGNLLVVALLGDGDSNQNQYQFIQDINSTIDNLEINDEFETSLEDNDGKKVKFLFS